MEFLCWIPMKARFVMDNDRAIVKADITGLLFAFILANINWPFSKSQSGMTSQQLGQEVSVFVLAVTVCVVTIDSSSNQEPWSHKTRNHYIIWLFYSIYVQTWESILLRNQTVLTKHFICNCTVLNLWPLRSERWEGEQYRVKERKSETCNYTA